MERINLTGEMDTFSMYVLHLPPPTVCQKSLFVSQMCWSSDNPEILVWDPPRSTSLLKEWDPLAAPRAALAQALAAPRGASQRSKSTGKGKGNSEFPFETSFASWQLREVAVTFQERKLFQYIPSCFNFPLVISSLVSMIKPHFRWHKRLIQSYIWGL